MSEKQYRLNKWGTRLLKNNRPLFDWTNESDNIVDLLNELHEENIELHIQNDFLKDENQHMRDLVNENKQLKKELFEERKDYILETYADNPVRRDERLKELEKELEE